MYLILLVLNYLMHLVNDAFVVGAIDDNDVDDYDDYVIQRQLKYLGVVRLKRQEMVEPVLEAVSETVALNLVIDPVVNRFVVVIEGEDDDAPMKTMVVVHVVTNEMQTVAAALIVVGVVLILLVMNALRIISIHVVNIFVIVDVVVAEDVVMYEMQAEAVLLISFSYYLIILNPILMVVLVPMLLSQKILHDIVHVAHNHYLNISLI